MTEYYIIDRNGNQIGPITEVMFDKYNVEPSTYVWREGLPRWVHASQLDELRGYFNRRPRAVPPPVTPPNMPPIDDNDSDFIIPQRRKSVGNDKFGSYGNNNGNYSGNNNGNYNPDYNGSYAIPCPPTYYGVSILATILGFMCGIVGLTFGVIALVNSSRVEKRWRQGYIDQARKSSRYALIFSVIGLVMSVLSTLIFFSYYNLI